MISFELIKFHFNCCFNLRFGCFNISDKSVADTNIIRDLFKGCFKWWTIFLLFNDFRLKLVGCFFDHLGIFWDSNSLWFEINQFFKLFVKMFILFGVFYFGEVDHGLDWSVEDSFSHNRLRLVNIFMDSLEIVMLSLDPDHVFMERDIMRNRVFGLVYCSDFDRKIASW